MIETDKRLSSTGSSQQAPLFPPNVWDIVFRRLGALKGKDLADRRNSFVLLSDVGVYGEFRIFVVSKKHFLYRSLSLSSGVSLPDSFPVFWRVPL